MDTGTALHTVRASVHRNVEDLTILDEQLAID